MSVWLLVVDCFHQSLQMFLVNNRLIKGNFRSDSLSAASLDATLVLHLNVRSFVVMDFVPFFSVHEGVPSVTDK
jgi:hypothetical protein